MSNEYINYFHNVHINYIYINLNNRFIEVYLTPIFWFVYPKKV